MAGILHAYIHLTHEKNSIVKVIQAYKILQGSFCVQISPFKIITASFWGVLTGAILTSFCKILIPTSKMADPLKIKFGATLISIIFAPFDK
jgi:hypothetical protein